MGMTDGERAELFAKKFAIAKGVIEAKTSDIAAACGRRLDPAKLIRVSLSYLADPANEGVVIKSTPESIAKTILLFGQIGLYPDSSLSYGYFTPYDGECKPSFGYKGLIHLALRDERIASIDAQAVYQTQDGEGDRFEPMLGTSPGIVHIPSYTKRGDNEEAPITWVYAVAHLKAGPPKIEVMAREQVEAIRATSFRPKATPWVRYWGQMARKTVVRRMMNYLDLSPDIAEVIAADVYEFPDDNEATIGTANNSGGITVPSFHDRLKKSAQEYEGKA